MGGALSWGRPIRGRPRATRRDPFRGQSRTRPRVSCTQRNEKGVHFWLTSPFENAPPPAVTTRMLRSCTRALTALCPAGILPGSRAPRPAGVRSGGFLLHFTALGRAGTIIPRLQPRFAAIPRPAGHAPGLLVVCVALDPGGRKDRFFVLTTGELQRIVIQHYSEFMEPHGWVRPKEPASMDVRYELERLVPHEDRWDRIAGRL